MISVISLFFSHIQNESTKSRIDSTLLLHQLRAIESITVWGDAWQIGLTILAIKMLFWVVSVGTT